MSGWDEDHLNDDGSAGVLLLAGAVELAVDVGLTVVDGAVVGAVVGVVVGALPPLVAGTHCE
jgi:hypothetical protein